VCGKTVCPTHRHQLYRMLEVQKNGEKRPRGKRHSVCGGNVCRLGGGGGRASGGAMTGERQVESKKKKLALSVERVDQERMRV